ncbi:tyrosine-type recombinase/integrase [Kribbella sp. NPDC058245]|uniref:tyrosine-type recombinase/integrase n=1 Tax=Kribbella sp. NPDC058245 TaxID=3346399 RepID=UPI0036ED58AA
MTNKNTARRRKGEGSIGRLHDHATCPPVGPDRKRPEHRCQGRYRARIWVETITGQRTRPTAYGKTEAEAVTKLKQLIAQDVTKTVTEGRMTVGQWLQPDPEDGVENYWTLAVGGWKVNTRKGVRSKTNTYIIPALGRVRLDKVTPVHVQKLYDSMRQRGLAEATVRGVHMILLRAFKIAVRLGLMVRNVCELLDAPGTVTNKRPPLSVAQAWAVLRLCGSNPRFWLALLNGIRQGEALGMRWMDLNLEVDPEVGVPHLVIRQALSWDESHKPVFDTPKSAESTDRIVPLLAPVVERLRLHHAAEVAAGRGKPEDLVFPNPKTGRPMDNRLDWTMWSALLVLAGVDHVALHAARNTTAALLENAGVPDRVVAAILGHATVQQTHRYQADNTAALVDATERLGLYMDNQQMSFPVAS